MTTDIPPPPPPPPPPAAPISPEPPKQSKRGRHIAYFAGGLVIVGLLVGSAFWFLRGDSDEAAEAASAVAAAVPPDAQMYFEVNLDQTPDLLRLVAAFEQAGAADLAEGLGDQLELDVGEGLGLLQELQDLLRDDVGIDPAALADWVGGRAALAVYGMELTDAGDASVPDVLVSVAVDDRAAASDFLDETIPTLEERHGLDFTESEYEGVTFHQAAGADLSEEMDGETLIVGLAGDSLLLGNDMALLERAVDARSGSSLGDLAEFKDVMAALPEGAVVNGFIGSNVISAFAEGALSADLGEVAEGLPLPGFSTEDIEAYLDQLSGIGMAVLLTDDAVRFDTVVVHDGDVPVELSGAGGFADRFPAGTVAYLGIPPFDVAAAWDALIGFLSEMPTEEGGMSIEDTLTLAEYTLGIDLEEGLIYRLTGEVGLGVVPAAGGILSEAAGADLGIIAAAGLDDPAVVAESLNGLAGGLGLLGIEPTPVTVAGETFFMLSDGTSDLAMFGVAGGNLMISTHADLVSGMLEGGDRLSGTDLYTRAAASLPGDPMLFVDVGGLLDAFGMPEDEAAGLAPLEAMAASMSQEDGLARFTLIALIDY